MKLFLGESSLCCWCIIDLSALQKCTYCTGDYAVYGERVWRFIIETPEYFEGKKKEKKKLICIWVFLLFGVLCVTLAVVRKAQTTRHDTPDLWFGGTCVNMPKARNTYWDMFSFPFLHFGDLHKIKLGNNYRLFCKAEKLSSSSSSCKALRHYICDVVQKCLSIEPLGLLHCY